MVTKYLSHFCDSNSGAFSSYIISTNYKDTGSFPGLRPELATDHSPPSSAAVIEE